MQIWNKTVSLCVTCVSNSVPFNPSPGPMLINVLEDSARRMVQDEEVSNTTHQSVPLVPQWQ